MNIIALIIASTGLTLGMAAQTEPEPTKDAACPLRATHKGEHPKVDAALYANAKWPAHNSAEDFDARNLHGLKFPLGLGKETILSEDMSFKDLDGKVLIVDFWATWCGPCISAAPKLETLQNTYKGKLQVVSVSGLREDEQTVRSFIKEHDEPFMHLYDDKQTLFKQFESKWIPLVAVVSTDGVVRWMGNPHDEDFQPAVEQVMRADPLINNNG